MVLQRGFDSTGSMVYWNLDLTSHEKLTLVLDRHGFGGYLPAKRTQYEALKAAVSEYKGRKQIMQSLANKELNGVELVDVDKGDEANEYKQFASIRVNEFGTLFIRNGNADLAALQALYDTHAGLITAGDVGQCLIGIVMGPLQGTSMRTSGGLYWLPPESVSRWEALACDVEGCVVGDNHEVASIRTVMNSRTSGHIIKSLTQQILCEANDIINAVRNSKDSEKIQARVDRCSQLQAMVSSYSETLGHSMENLQAVLTLANRMATTAAMAALA